jgi:ADP-heptose:LPS heptosyltransferase
MHTPLKGVVNFLGRTDLRQLIRLTYHAQGVLCGLTMLMHLAAAFEKPAVILAGGREPKPWNQYPLQVQLNSVGQLPCCRTASCWKSRTIRLADDAHQNQADKLCEQPVLTEPPAPRCMAQISPAEVAEAILKFQA